jgi:two-component system sensor histidine kinase DesK
VRTATSLSALARIRSLSVSGVIGAVRQWMGFGRTWALTFAVGYLVYLVYPVAAELSGHHHPAEVVGTLLGGALFVTIYLIFWARLYPGDGLGGLAALTALLALAVLLTVVDNAWAGTFIYCAAVAGAAFSARRSLAAVGLATAVGVLVAVLDGGLSWLSWSAAIMVLTGLGMVGIRFMVVTTKQLQRAQEERARLAVAEERLRFARDLHDLLGHSLSVIVLKSELAGRLGPTDPERALAEIRDVERVAREALREVREAVAGYRQPSLSQELERARATLAAAGVEVRLHHLAREPVPAPLDGILAWAVREAVTNVVRHSRARRAEIRLERGPEHVRLEVLDDGVGCASFQMGNGLRGLRERVMGRRGRIEFGHRSGGGFRLAVSLPLTATRPEVGVLARP